jgi:hypothetical protein
LLKRRGAEIIHFHIAAGRSGAEIHDIFYITRDEPFPHMYENADFSPKITKNSIKEGENEDK